MVSSDELYPGNRPNTCMPICCSVSSSVRPSSECSTIYPRREESLGDRKNDWLARTRSSSPRSAVAAISGRIGTPCFYHLALSLHKQTPLFASPRSSTPRVPRRLRVVAAKPLTVIPCKYREFSPVTHRESPALPWRGSPCVHWVTLLPLHVAVTSRASLCAPHYLD